MIDSLYDIFNKNWVKEGGTIWLYSDPHFGDLDSYILRFPDYFSSIPYEEEYLRYAIQGLDEMQIKHINSKCGKNDTLIILGDVGEENCVARLKARYKVLIMGNHDKGASNYKRNLAKVSTTIWDEGKKYTFVNEVPSDDDNHLFDEVYAGGLQIGEKIYLSHEPVKNRYCLNIHGHRHDILSKVWYDKYYNEEFNETVDLVYYNAIAEANDYYPVQLTGIIKLGLLNKISGIHRVATDGAIKRKERKEN